jgi:hypothetical protein
MDELNHMLESLFHFSNLLERDVGPYLRQTWDLIKQRDFTGFDPGSIRSEQYERFLIKGTHPIARIWNAVFHRTVRMAGYTGLRILNLPQVTSTKAVALCASGFASLARAFPCAYFSHQGLSLLERLEQLRHPEMEVWPVDFTYRIQGDQISLERPGLINSLFAAEAFWDWFQITGDPRWRESYVNVAKSLIDLIPRIETEDSCCFTYNPATKYYVHNANMLMAALLARTSHLSGGDVSLEQLVRKCLNYTLHDIKRTRSVPYAGPPTSNDSVDNYHTGYILRSMRTIRECAATYADLERIDWALSFLLDFYLKHFTDDNGVYKYPGRRLIQTHSLAEALIVYAQFHSFAPEQFRRCGFAEGVRAAFDHLWDDRRGYFINESIKMPLGLKWRDVTPMVRWAWSWMFYAMANVLEYEASDKRQCW